MCKVPPCTHRGSRRTFFEPFGLFGGQRLNRMNFGYQHFIPLFVFSFGISFGFSATEFKDAEITTLKNIVEHDAGQGAAPAKVSEMIRENSKVTTAAASMAELTFGDSSITRIGANSVFSFQSKERLVKLDKGTALIHATPGNGGATVDCGGVTAAVSGSTFMASRSATGGAVFVLLESSGSLKVTTPGGQTATILPGQAASTGIGPKSAIQVFDVDVKKVMETTPLVGGFKELPSQAEINVVTEKQQAMIREGKIEALGVEVVATGEDGDLLVGAPRERPEPGAGGDGLDVETAAGGDGKGAVAGAKPPPPPGAGTGMNAGSAQGPGLDSSFLSAQRKLAEAAGQSPTQLNVTLPEGISEGTLQAGTISLNSPAVQAVPVTLVSASGRNITFSFPEGSTIPVGATSIPFTFTVADDGYISNGGAVSAPLSILAFASNLSAMGGGLVADITSGIDPVGAASGTLQPGNSENPFTIRLPGKVAADLDAKVTLETFRNGIKIGSVNKDVVIRAGESVLSLTGNSLPDPKIYSSEAMDITVTVALAQIGKTISKDVRILPRSLDHAVIRAANPIRNLLSSVNTALSWSGTSDATAYEITATSLGVTKTKLVLDNVYHWMDGIASSATVEVKALVSGIQEGALTLNQDSKFKLLFGEQGKVSDIRKSSVEIFLAVLGSGGELVDSIILKDNGAGAFWITDTAGEAKQVASIDYDVGVVSLSEDALGKSLPLADVYYSTSFVEEKGLNSFTKVDTSAGLSDSELIQADKYFYFESKFGVEGPTKFFANAPLELDLAKMNNWGASTSWLDQNGLAAVDFDFYAANARVYLNDVSNEGSQPDQIAFNSDKVVLFADKISLLGEFEKSDGTRTVLDVSMKESSEMALTLIGGKDGIDVSNVFLNVNGADLTMETSAGVFMDSTHVNDVGNKFEVSAANSVKMGSDGGTSEVTVQAKSDTANSMAVIRTGDSLELRRVVLKSFARGEIVSVSAENKGRVLLSAAIARDFHINELVNAVIVADAQGQADPLRSSSVDIVAQGADLTVEGNLPIRTAKYQGIDVHGYNVNLDASRIALSGARITAINAITAKAQTLVIDSSILRVVNAVGSINLYSGSGFVNQQYGTVAEGMVNFSGSNIFKIGDQTVSISSAQDVQNALNSGMMIQGAASPIGGKINILPANNVSSAATSQLN
jgi:FecR protein